MLAVYESTLYVKMQESTDQMRLLLLPTDAKQTE